MKTLRISDDLVQFNSYLAPIDLSFNQYLLLGAEPLLVHTGAAGSVNQLLAHLEDALAGRDLAYIFASHFESDECGGFAALRTRYPRVKLLCSEVTARETGGFGVAGGCGATGHSDAVDGPGAGGDSDAIDVCLTQQPGAVLETGDARLEFLVYPSEVHLWDGLVLFERRRGVLFSSDLFGRFGQVEGEPEAGVWRDLVASLGLDRIPSPAGLQATQNALADLPVTLVAPGHGPCVRV